MPQHFYPMWAPDGDEGPRIPWGRLVLWFFLIVGVAVLLGGGFMVWYELSGRPWWLLSR